MPRSPSAPPSVQYVAPFAVFLALLALHSVLPLPDLADQILRIAVVAAAILWFSSGVLDFRAPHWFASVLLGAAVFALWIAPDLLFPNYRHFWLFNNPVTGSIHSSLSPAAHGDSTVLALRTLRAVVIVPIVEELFWRAWLMRWLISPHFQKLPLGAYTAASFWIVAALFASEHGPYWDVGLITGIIYNYWMVRTKNLGDLILTHAVTNACLSAYVIGAGKWEYWL
ncbi:MAG: CAAX prenyl protease-related protein [Bryobacteraceae bacterium]